VAGAEQDHRKVGRGDEVGELPAGAVGEQVGGGAGGLGRLEQAPAGGGFVGGELALQALPGGHGVGPGLPVGGAVGGDAFEGQPHDAAAALAERRAEGEAHQPRRAAHFQQGPRGAGGQPFELAAADAAEAGLGTNEHGGAGLPGR
jgi:hypothetical protein